MPAKVDSIINSIMRGNKNVKNKSQAIKIAKDQGLIKQKGDGLALTEKGRQADTDDGG